MGNPRSEERRVMRSLTARLFREEEEGPLRVGLIATETMRGGLLHAADSGKGLDQPCLEACNAGSEEKPGLRDDKSVLSG
jgi:hypothetical protein